MSKEKRIRLFQDVFDPKPEEKVIFVIDIPHGEIEDNELWKERRQMALEWMEDFRSLVSEVELLEFPATGMNNSTIPDSVKQRIREFDIVLAMTEWSMTAELKPIAKEGKIRGASMPKVSREMEETALSADYSEVQRKALAIKELLDRAEKATVTFSTGHQLHFDLRNRTASADGGDAREKGLVINLPSGEAYIVPYEGEDEILGESKTKGDWPVNKNGEEIIFSVDNNKITNVVGDGAEAENYRRFFSEKDSRRNVAELGIGCNSSAAVGSGIVLEEEKAGPHIAYGKSTHFPCGTVESDVHQDIVYAKGCAIEASEIILDEEIVLVKNCELNEEVLDS